MKGPRTPQRFWVPNTRIGWETAGTAFGEPLHAWIPIVRLSLAQEDVEARNTKADEQAVIVTAGMIDYELRLKVLRMLKVYAKAIEAAWGLTPDLAQEEET
jgi:hypothetical protein